MIRIRRGTVSKIESSYDLSTVVEVNYDGLTQKAINYNFLTGDIYEGDIVYINTSSTYLGLGTGGYDFIIINETRGSSIDFEDGSHIMKMRYTPYQVKCNTVCEVGNDIWKKAKNFTGLNGKNVLIGELHSMLAPCACTLKYLNKDIKITYIMTDGGSLPIEFSQSVRELKRKGIINNTVTSGNSFGGDIEAVNIYDALVVASSVLECDIAIITMGPGIVGTGTKYGFSGIEQGYIIDAVNNLHGRPIVIPRLSFKDKRKRHYGISHHTLTILSEISNTSANVIFPVLEKDKDQYIKWQINQSGIAKKHNIKFIKSNMVFDAVKKFNVKCMTMNRGLYDDIEFFLTCSSAAFYALHYL